MKLLGEYKNGNYTVQIFDDGTKIRETEGDNFIPEFPESMDINITDRCDNNCEFCYAGATPKGKHGDILNVKFIDTLRPYTEVALNGNDLSHPDLFEFLVRLKKKNIIASMTVNQVHFMRYIEIITRLVELDLIKGLGVSLVNPTDEFIVMIKSFPNAVIHIINGIVTMEQLEKLYDNNLKVLILGYKELGRGKDYYSQEVEDNKKVIYDNITDIIHRFKVVSFDNLALQQLDLQRIMSKERWDKFYMGDDGLTSMYIDIPKCRFARSSLSTKYYDLLDNIDDMFKIIQNEIRGNVKMERRIYNGWAFSENELDKSRINEEIYNELIERYKVYRNDLSFNPDVDYDGYDIIIGRRAGYNHSVYNILKNSPGLSTEELLLICDGGNLCFGGSKIGKNQLRVSED